MVRLIFPLMSVVVLSVSCTSGVKVDDSETLTASGTETGISNCYQQLYFVDAQGSGSQARLSVAYASGTCQYKDKDGWRTLDQTAVRDHVYVADAGASHFLPAEANKLSLFVDAKDNVYARGEDGESQKIGSLADGRVAWSRVVLDGSAFGRMVLSVNGQAVETSDRKAADSAKSLWLVRR